MTELIFKSINLNNIRVCYAIIFNVKFNSPSNGDLQESNMYLHVTTNHSYTTTSL